MNRISLALLASLPCCAAFVASAALADGGSGYTAPAFRSVVQDDEEQHQPAPRAKDAGVLDGHVTAVDYRNNTMTVRSGSRKVDVVVLPSTNIRGADNDFRTIADITKGAKVRVTMSRRGDLFTAQIIHLTP